MSIEGEEKRLSADYADCAGWGRRGKSRNHGDTSGGDVINVGWLDYHTTSGERRADIGYKMDAIYGAGGGGGPDRGGNKGGVNNHRDPMDSYLIGPVKEEE